MFSNLRFSALTVVITALAAISPPRAVAGPVGILAQDRSVHVAIPSIVEAEPAVDEATTAPDNNPFSATLDRTLNQLGQTNHSLASQTSSFGNAGDVFSVSATGETRYSATGLSGIVFAESDFMVQFQIAETRDYTINGTGSFVDTGGGASNFSVILTGPGGTVASFAKSDFNPNNDDGAVVTPSFGTSGTLTPGTYTLNALSGVSGGTNSNEIRASYQVTFSATDGSGAAIPLPTGAGSGALLLAVAVAACWARRRKLSTSLC